MKSKQVKSIAVAMLVAGITSATSGYRKIADACAAAVLEGFHLNADGKAGTLKEQRTALIAWARDTCEFAKLDWTSVKTYVSQAASIAIAPHVTAKIETGPKGKTSVQTVTSGDFKTRAEFAAVATAAGEACGLAKRGIRTASVPDDTKAKQAANDAARTELFTQAASKAGADALLQIVALCFDGQHEAHRDRLVFALRTAGYKLMPIEHKAPAPSVTEKVDPVPAWVAPSQVAPSRGQKAAATRRANEAQKALLATRAVADVEAARKSAQVSKAAIARLAAIVKADKARAMHKA